MTADARAYEVLILFAEAALVTNTVSDHLGAFRRFSRHRFALADSRAFAAIDADLSDYDCIVLHYSIVLSMDTFISENLARAISNFDGLKVAYIQDEYRFVDRQNKAILDLGIDLVFTVTNPEVTRLIYRGSELDHVRFEHTLTGFVPEHLRDRPVPAYEERPLDVVYRARKAPAWYGAFAAEKWQIADRFKDDAIHHGLSVDIETTESSRIYGEDWIKFLENSKAVLGTESGVSFIDFTGDVQQQAEAFEAANPGVPQAEIRAKFLGNADGRIVIRVVSPRIFEAATLKTLMILYEGAYSGAVQPWRHYVPLNRDHSNIDEVVTILRSTGKAKAIIERAYREVALSPEWTFAAMVEQFDRVIDEEMASRAFRPARTGFEVLTPIEAAVGGSVVRRLERERYLESVVLPAYNNLVASYQDLARSFQELAAVNQALNGQLQEAELELASLRHPPDLPAPVYSEASTHSSSLFGAAVTRAVGRLRDFARHHQLRAGRNMDAK